MNPDITSVSIEIEGVPNRLYSKGMVLTDLWSSIKQRYDTDNLSESDFYSDKFALWIDLRSHFDQ